MELSKGGRSLLQGRGEELDTLETEGQMIQRVMPDLMGLKNILVLNDEAHHCYRGSPEMLLKRIGWERSKRLRRTTRPHGFGSPVLKRLNASWGLSESLISRQRPFSFGVPATPRALCSRGP